MKAWMPFAVVIAALLFIPKVHAQDKVLLKNEHKPGDGWHVKLDMTLTGKIKIKDGEKTITLDLKAAAKHDFEERVLTARDGLPTGMGRFYKQAQADISLQGKAIAKTLRPERRF